MAILIRLKSATLVETIVATILIVVIFVVASVVLNNLMLSVFLKNTHQAETRLNELEYQIGQGNVIVPFEESTDNLEITIRKTESPEGPLLIFTAVNKQNNKEIMRTRIYEKD